MTNIMSVQGNFQRFIRLHTHQDLAFAYFTDFNHILPRLPEVDRVLRYKDGRYRMIFMADDGRGHEMGVVFDIRHETIHNRVVKMISVPIDPQDLNKKTAAGEPPLFPGKMSGEVVLRQQVGHVEVIYQLELLIEIDVPGFLSFIPKPVLQKIGDSLMKYKMHAIGDGYADRMVEEYQDWHITNATRVGEEVHLTDNLARHAELTPKLN
jgi:hypothetical protein